MNPLCSTKWQRRFNTAAPREGLERPQICKRKKAQACRMGKSRNCDQFTVQKVVKKSDTRLPADQHHFRLPLPSFRRSPSAPASARWRILVRWFRRNGSAPTSWGRILTPLCAAACCQGSAFTFIDQMIVNFKACSKWRDFIKFGKSLIQSSSLEPIHPTKSTLSTSSASSYFQPG